MNYRVHLERCERELGAVAWHLTRVQWTRIGPAFPWAPAINAYRCPREFVVCVDLAGVDPAAVSLHVEPRRLVIQGSRQPPEPPCDSATGSPPQLLALEIDYGPFARELTFPDDVDPGGLRVEGRNGYLWITLPVRLAV